MRMFLHFLATRCFYSSLLGFFLWFVHAVTIPFLTVDDDDDDDGIVVFVARAAVLVILYITIVIIRLIF